MTRPTITIAAIWFTFGAVFAYACVEATASDPCSAVSNTYKMMATEYLSQLGLVDTGLIYEHEALAMDRAGEVGEVYNVSCYLEIQK